MLYVNLKGELTKDTVNKLDKRVTKRLNNDYILNLVFNVSKLKLIDYKGISKLLYNYEIINKKKGKVLLYGNNINICGLLKKSRLLNYICECDGKVNI